MKKTFCLFLILWISVPIYGQENRSSDELFVEARHAAFQEKNYPKAIDLAKSALQKSPDYTDISIFLGRLYTWSDNPAAAREVFEGLDQRNVEDVDFFIAYASLEYWNDHYEKSIALLDKGLGFHPDSEDLLLLKAKVYNSNNKFAESEQAVLKLLELNPKNTEARSLYARIKELTSKNALGISYDFSHFDKQFDDNWHILSLSYKRTTPIGSVILKANYANKFAENGMQFEMEAYPRLSKTFYMYVGAGYSGAVGIFPKFRTGASLYANLPKSFEGEIGFRQLYFSNSIWMYTASIGKYYKNFWFNLRTYITPGNENISQSYTGTVRYYTKGANDYFSFQLGTGISPEESINSLLQNETYKLKTYKIGAGYSFSINKMNFFSISATYFNQEYRPYTKGSQIDLSLGYTRAF